MKKTNELFISLGWEVISAVLWTEGLLNSALDFLYLFLLSLSLSSLSPFLCIWTARSLHYTQGNYWSMEEPLANCSWLIDPEALTPRSVTLVERKPVLLLVVSLLDLCIKTKGFLCIDTTPPPSFPKNVCVSTYSNKAFLCIKSFCVKF